jgi:carboxylate-amine ligase
MGRGIDRGRGRSADGIRRSIEVEYWVVDGRGRLVEPDGLVEAAPGVEREFVEPLLEVKTTPCTTDAELRAELLDRLGAVLDRADELDRGLVPLATPIRADSVAELPAERTRIQNEVVGEAFAFVRHCAGTHIHVEQQPEAAVDQLNTFVALDPALALVNSSPYFRGRRLSTGARSELYRRRAYADLPHQGRLWPYIGSREEWQRRLERRYEAFETAALSAGVDRTALAAAFDPESAIWTPIQFRERFGTVEWRSPDTALPSQVLGLASTLADTVDQVRRGTVRVGDEPARVDDGEVVLPSFDVVLERVDDAIDEGLESRALRDYLDRMGFDIGAYDPLAAELDGRAPVSASDARDLRLEYADRLRQDIRRARSIDAD